MKVWWFGICTYFAYFQVIIVKEIKIEDCNLVHFEVVIAKKKLIQKIITTEQINMGVNGKFCCRGFKS